MVITQKKKPRQKETGTLADYYALEGYPKMRTLKDWCRYLKLSYKKVFFRMAELGWEFEEAIQPIEGRLIHYEDDIRTLQDWCTLFDLELPAVAIRILRGELFENIVRE